ncbi:hypothetical protein BK816_00400 [Boudabousia tangfeifanii]|uniref:SLH domain-containing protein n=1 Tax=Boudabousia tangfeifanii TaxID=1912795 RepID=A0A1D9MIC3_9ACTO|nr:S-layer homology domain-containing protein [Boudabousia tangfeifanii]AOZ71939.1 hypothetical protein BK816_00400 [Boudabousia tangfeifanii]
MRSRSLVAIAATTGLAISGLLPALTPMVTGENSVPAAQAATKIVVASAKARGGKFVDVPANMFLSGEMAWLADKGISTGWPAGNNQRAYRPLINIERQAMAAFLYRMAGIKNYQAPATSKFADVPTNHPFYQQISWMASTGITTGWVRDGKRYFNPDGPVNRDAMAAFIYRFAGKYPAKVSKAVRSVTKNFNPSGTVFADVTKGTDFAKEMEWLRRTLISTGWPGSNGKRYYRPVTPIHRDAMAAFLYRLQNNKLVNIPPRKANLAKGKNWLKQSCRSSPDEINCNRPLPLNVDTAAALNQYKNLTKLRLRVSDKHEVSNDFVLKLSSLKLLQLSAYYNDKKVHPFPNIKHLPKLEKLYLTDMNGHPYPVAKVPAFYAPNLKDFDIHRSYITLKRLPLTKVEAFKAPKLEHFKIDGASISSLPKLNLPKLRGLYLTDNKLSRLPDISAMPSLEKAYFTDNPIRNVANARLPRNLKTLGLQRNQLTSFSGLRSGSLEYLYLTGNQIRTVDTRSINLPRLKRLEMADNKLRRLPTLVFPSLQTLDVSRNYLKLKPVVKTNYKYLHILWGGQHV